VDLDRVGLGAHSQQQQKQCGNNLPDTWAVSFQNATVARLVKKCPVSYGTEVTLSFS
jgi:hypothetical protein